MVKRTRVGTASTLVDTNVINYVTSPMQHCSAEKTAPENDLSPLVIEQSSGVECGPLSGVAFSLASPEICDVVRHGSDRIGVFLEQCFYCKRRLLVNKAVFMYSEHAFCTPDCRGIQIMMDEAKERIIGKRKVLD